MSTTSRAIAKMDKRWRDHDNIGSDQPQGPAFVVNPLDKVPIARQRQFPEGSQGQLRLPRFGAWQRDHQAAKLLVTMRATDMPPHTKFQIGPL
jgi:hypothetical protein